MVGLQSTFFGILLCSMQSMHVIIPLNELKEEASIIIVKGVEKVSVLLVVRALQQVRTNQKHGAGTKTNPQCTLHTSLKQMFLLKLEQILCS